MRILRLYLVFLFIPFIQPAAATGAEFKGVQELLFVDQIDTSDKYNASIILQRCSGMFRALSMLLPGDMRKEKAKLDLKSFRILTMATQVMAEKRGLPSDSAVVKNEVNKAFNSYVDIYYKHMEDNQIKTGSVFDDFINGEQDTCISLTN